MGNKELGHAMPEEHGRDLTGKDSVALLLLQNNVIADWLKEEHKGSDAGTEWIGQYAARAREIFDSEGDYFIALVRDGRTEEAKKEMQKRLYH